ncbi:lipoyl(octanoyl) transferase LipB [Coraliomargarita sp. SDUM461003]|uniref:Octanoyltransferase n=1 Tax=Thalassobacterium maritimum TaxID=3041265 RepID=A0ABU1AS44_9BACT|nr:lipoyl(octanoyl) transferase LipB [Coraliomargarita sp. SDUM461003]MDQ8206986.1 lipoyl(octanoyl) transferase LipB [Coraliomargarita sp. SDUM461003]
MRILCLQHVPFEGPAAIADWAHSRGHSLHCHLVFEQGTLPALDRFDLLLVMGGPMNIYEVEAHPWLIAEKELIVSAIAAGKYLVGICLGAQLIADALGAAVTAGPQAEIGWYPIQSEEKAPAWLELPEELRVLHWHGDRFELPAGATRIASSAACPNQAFLYNERVLAWQCHLETTSESLAALIENCSDELAQTGPYLMTAEQLQAEPAHTYNQMRQALFKILDGMTAPLEVIDWGRTDYEDAFARQKERVDLRRMGQCRDALILTEHSPVYTMGMRKDAAQHLIWAQAECTRLGIDVVQSNRGGDITYHGPGQLVGYPILSLRHRRDLHAYLRDLEEVVIRTLATYGLQSARREGKTGIWIDNQRKICAIGVAVRSWISYHGFALNVNPDMNHFSGIVPCGITDGTVTSLTNELDKKVDIEEVKTRLAVEFETVFGNTARQDG